MPLTGRTEDNFDKYFLNLYFENIDKLHVYTRAEGNFDLFFEMKRPVESIKQLQRGNSGVRSPLNTF